VNRTDPTSDEALVARIAKGDRLAMRALYARCHVRVYRFILRFVRNEATAEDVMSEVFLDVWRQVGRVPRRARHRGGAFFLPAARSVVPASARQRPRHCR
jgi:RNA polymerase sigma-70 factor, ECF subfamily